MKSKAKNIASSCNKQTKGLNSVERRSNSWKRQMKSLQDKFSGWKDKYNS